MSAPKSPVWLGAYSPGGLSLPAAQPTPSQLYAPRGVWLDDEWLAAADSGNHRVLLWRGAPDADGRAADIVLGQPDFFTEGPKLLHLPTGLGIFAGRLLVADSWHHRVLVWNRVPEASGTPPDYAIGQADVQAVEPNRGLGRPSAESLYWPYGLGWVNGWLWIADTGNRRVLGWPGIPDAGEPAAVVLGQNDAALAGENRDGPVSARSFRWPHAIAGDARHLLVADAGNHRVLGWRPVPAGDADASLVLGQPDFESSAEFAYVKQGPAKLRFPYCLALEGDRLAVADTANNRVLIWDGARQARPGAPANLVLGQDSFETNGENRWKAVTHDSLCWPYGIALHRGRLAVADSGNNRVLLWEVPAAEAARKEEQEHHVLGCAG